jgi:CxxC motif-containing protein (DUF1111 family)
MNYSHLSRALLSHSAVFALALACGVAAPAFAQTDPGPRGGSPGAGGPLAGLSTDEAAYFTAALGRFQEVDSVTGSLLDAPPGIQNGTGLGPRFNLNQCSGCHAQPAVGGSSPAVNPQVALATLDGGKNTLPSFITANGPVREVRFISNPDGTPDGGVHDVFVITGRSDAVGCNIAQPDFPQAVRQHNAIFRIPTPVFGAGLVENVPDNNLVSAEAAQASLQSSLGIVSGDFNHSGNDGTITRFGWKAQNKSVIIFAGEAYNVEQGVTSELFPNERDTTAGCQFNQLPEDVTNMEDSGISGSPASDYASDVVNFGAFMRLSAAPTPAPATASTTNGEKQFVNAGCAACHVTTQVTGQSVFTGASGVSIQPFSDFALHDMGDNLADNVSQGGASGRQFRSAPLWGLGQRLFFLHDGRSNNLVDAIMQHRSRGSEANQVVRNFECLTKQQQQDVLNFLRSL